MENHEIIMQAIREVANCETPEKFAESNQTVYNVAKRALEIANIPPVSIAEQDGERGVRLCVGDVDIFIEAHNLENGEEFQWKKAMARLEEVGKRTFTKHEGTLIVAYIDLINEKLREIGGDELDGYFWSSTEYGSNYAWSIGSSVKSGTIYSEVKCTHHEDGFWVVDAWKTNDQEEEGVVVAVINDVTGDCYAIRNLDDLAKGVIDEKQTEIVNRRPEVLAEIYNSMIDAEKDKFLRLTGNQ